MAPGRGGTDGGGMRGLHHQLRLLFFRDLPGRHPGGAGGAERGGIQGVPVGQREAAEVLGFTKPQIFFKVTLLQMIKRIVPPMSNEIITLVKDTSLARAIALQEVIWAAESFMKGNQGISGLWWPLMFTAVYYLAFSAIVTMVLGRLEKKLDYFRV